MWPHRKKTAFSFNIDFKSRQLYCGDWNLDSIILHKNFRNSAQCFCWLCAVFEVKFRASNDPSNIHNELPQCSTMDLQAVRWQTFLLLQAQRCGTVFQFNWDRPMLATNSLSDCLRLFCSVMRSQRIVTSVKLCLEKLPYLVAYLLMWPTQIKMPPFMNKVNR